MPRHIPSRLNQAIAMSRGKYFARMDGDDISYPQRLQVQVEYLENHPDIDVLGTQIIVFDGEGNPRGKCSQQLSHAEICCRPWANFKMTHPTWMGKLEWFRTHQYRPKAIRMEDQDILLRTYKESRFACLGDILLGYRIESLSLKKSLSSRYHHSLILLEKAFLDKDLILAYGVLEHTAKALVEIFAVITGLNFRIIRHRVGQPLDSQDLIQWGQVWDKCHSSMESV